MLLLEYQAVRSMTLLVVFAGWQLLSKPKKVSLEKKRKLKQVKNI